MRLFQFASLFFLVSLFSIGCGFEHQPSLQNKVQKVLSQGPDTTGDLPKSYENPTPKEQECVDDCNVDAAAAIKSCPEVKWYYYSPCIKKAKRDWHACIRECFEDG